MAEHFRAGERKCSHCGSKAHDARHHAPTPRLENPGKAKRGLRGLWRTLDRSGWKLNLGKPNLDLSPAEKGRKQQAKKRTKRRGHQVQKAKEPS